MNAQETAAPSSPFELRWRLLGIRFSIAPSFWIMSALMGWLTIGSLARRKDSQDFVAMLFDNDVGTLGGSFWGCLLLWVLCTLVSVLVHEMGHVLVGRIFGQPGNIALAGLGGQASGKYEALTSWQRILVAAAGPSAGFLFLGLQTIVDSSQWNLVMDFLTDYSTIFAKLKLRIYLIDQIDPLLRMSRNYYGRAMLFLLIMNLLWNLLNLLPIYPMDGGMILRELCCMVSPVGGLKFAFGFSFLVSGLVVVYCLLSITVRRELPTIVDPYLGIIMFGMLAYQNFNLLRQVTMQQKQAHFQDRPDD